METASPTKSWTPLVGLVGSVARVVLAGSTLLLFATGLYLLFIYVPVAAKAWDDIATVQSADAFGKAMQLVHQISTVLWILSATTLALVHLTKSNVRAVAMLVVGFALVLVAVDSGRSVLWGDIALWRQVNGSGIGGYGVLFGDNMTFVLPDGGVSLADIRNRFLTHLVGGTLGLLAALAALATKQPDPAP